MSMTARQATCAARPEIMMAILYAFQRDILSRDALLLTFVVMHGNVAFVESHLILYELSLPFIKT